MSKQNVIIIGSGLGGLIAGALTGHRRNTWRELTF